MKSPANNGFTLVEILVATICLMLVLIPLFQILQSGTKSSLQGILRVDTTLEARRILRQIQKDLKVSCFEVSAGFSGEILISSILETNGTFPNIEYRFSAFPTAGSSGDFIREGEKTVHRQLSRIKYLVRKSDNPAKPFLILTREEQFSPEHPLAATFPDGCRKTILSERVNFFQIVPRELETLSPFYNHSFFWVTLQLVDSLQTGALLQSPPENAWKPPGNGIILADFYDVVYPEFLNSFQDWCFMNRNWYNVLEWKGGK